MGDYRNKLSVDFYAMDENGTVIKFRPRGDVAGGDIKRGVSDYLQNYSELQQLTSAVATRNLPAPGVRNENMVFMPGTTYGSTKVLSTDVEGAYPATRRYRIVFDPTADTIRRTIKTEFLGLREVLTAAIPTTSSDLGMYLDIQTGDMYVVYLNNAGAKTLKGPF